MELKINYWICPDCHTYFSQPWNWTQPYNPVCDKCGKTRLCVPEQLPEGEWVSVTPIPFWETDWNISAAVTCLSNPTNPRRM